MFINSDYPCVISESVLLLIAGLAFLFRLQKYDYLYLFAILKRVHLRYLLVYSS